MTKKDVTHAKKVKVPALSGQTCPIAFWWLPPRREGADHTRFLLIGKGFVSVGGIGTWCSSSKTLWSLWPHCWNSQQVSCFHCHQPLLRPLRCNHSHLRHNRRCCYRPSKKKRLAVNAIAIPFVNFWHYWSKTFTYCYIFRSKQELFLKYCQIAVG